VSNVEGSNRQETFRGELRKTGKRDRNPLTMKIKKSMKDE
jgi:hypothetical protein